MHHAHKLIGGMEWQERRDELLCVVDMDPAKAMISSDGDLDCFGAD